MATKKRKPDALGPGMELVESGIDASKVVGGKRCICSPGGWSAGNTSGNGCACGCFENPASVNGDANRDLAQT